MTNIDSLALALRDAIQDSALNGLSEPTSYLDGDVSNVRIDGAYDLTKAATKVLEKIEKQESSEIGALALDAWIRDSKIATRDRILIAADSLLNKLIKIIEKQNSDYSPQRHIDADGGNGRVLQRNWPRRDCAILGSSRAKVVRMIDVFQPATR